ncbi:MAG: chemotaxis response regulator protein-glutamate methylesterase [Planctomyces sp.]|nr:chemotaxis response regulator protein-glutamate methylesterase [Planctomyces sp.]
MRRIKVLIVDDSALMRELLTDILSSSPQIEVVGTAGDPYIARDKILRLCPDVLTLDIEMPRMDGLTFLERLMASHPMPVIMVSSATERGCDTTFRALELGAIDFVTKPALNLDGGLKELSDEIIAKVIGAFRAGVRRRSRSPVIELTPAQASAGIMENKTAACNSAYKVVAIGTSTGGAEALLSILCQLPADSPGIVAVIHMPPVYTKSYAERLNRSCHVNVKEAEDGDRILPGHVLIAPGNYHLTVHRTGTICKVRISDTEKVSGFRPSVDVLFHSCARHLGSNAVGVILTGMGHDGAAGLLAMSLTGAHTIAQDERSCVVFGMPREAIKLQAATQVLPLDQIPAQILRHGYALPAESGGSRAGGSRAGGSTGGAPGTGSSDTGPPGMRLQGPASSEQSRVQCRSLNST